MADTSCAGRNWIMIEDTGFVCDVYPFKDGYEAVKDVPIATCATLVEGENGTDFILIGHEMLYFGHQMDRSLLNQNQIRHHIRHHNGRVQDDYTRTNEEFGIRTSDMFIPFQMRGAAVYFESRTPTPSELENLPHIVITSRDKWDPQQRPLRLAPTMRSSDATSASDYALLNVSSALHEHELRQRMIGSVRIHDWYDMPYEPRAQLPREPRAHLPNESRVIPPESKATLPRLGPDALLPSPESDAKLPPRATKEPEPPGIPDPSRPPMPRHDPRAQPLIICNTGTANVHATLTRHRHTPISPEAISRIWNIGLDTAQRTLRGTTQDGVRTAIHPITRRYRIDHLHLHRQRLNATFHKDTLLSRIPSIRGNNCAQVFTDGRFTAVYPLKSKSMAGDALREFSSDFGIPDTLVADLAGEQTGADTEFVKQIRRLDIRIHYAEKGRKNQNHHVEREIGILKTRWKRRMTANAIPMRLWDYGLVYEAEILSRMCRHEDGRSGLEILTGNTPDISEWVDFAFYDLVWYHVPKNDVNTEGRRLGRWLGISHRVGSDLCYWVLTKAGHVIASTTVQHVLESEFLDPAIRPVIAAFDLAVTTRLSDAAFIDNPIPGPSPYIQDIVDSPPEHQTRGLVPSLAEYGDMIATEEMRDADDYPDLDNFIHASLLLDVGNEKLHGRVIKRARDADGNPKGKPHRNPIFDTRAYLVEFKDGSVREYTANIIAENIYEQVDDEGRTYSILHEISGHRRDPTDAITAENAFMISKNGNRVPRRTTKGWELEVQWRGGETEWIPLKIMKAANPIEVAEYAVANGIQHEPAFSWWVKEVLRARRRIVSKVKSKYWRTTHKFGIRVPRNVEEALQFDKESGTDFWARAIEKELRKVKVAWEVRDDLEISDVRSGKALIGYTEIKCHMIFDVKMDFSRKARFVAGGHLTEAPSSITYSSVVSRDSVRLAFLIAELNDLDIMACDVGNAYLNAPCREKVWFKGGIDTGEDRGKILVITRALYGLKSSGASWRSTLATTLTDLGFQDTQADPDVWRRRATRPDGSHYYELCLVYVDDILMISHDPKPALLQIGALYELKEGSLGPPETYLGAQIYQHSLHDGRKAWGMSSVKYVKNAVSTVENLLIEDGDNFHLKTTAREPLPVTYKPELDISPELNDPLTSRFRQLIGILRWAVELGRLDIYYETAILSQYLASPREGHLEGAYHIFAYLKSHPKFSIVFDPKAPNLDESAFAPVDIKHWREFYGDVAEELPARMPEPLGNAVDITCFVDANHAGNVVTRRSHTGILIFVQNAPILWFSKKQNTVESSSFGSEFVALRIAKEMLVTYVRSPHTGTSVCSLRQSGRSQKCQSPGIYLVQTTQRH